MDRSFTDPVTGFKVQEPFASFYLANGGLPIFGRPISSWLSSNEQWFERSRFELHGTTIMLGLVGREAYDALKSEMLDVSERNHYL